MIIDGRVIAARRLEILKRKVEEVKRSKGITVKLVAVIVGDDPASLTYVRLKAKRAKEVGIESEVISLRERSKTDEVIEVINKLNRDKEVTGILVQLPLPNNVDTDRVLAAINPSKDVDGLTGASKFLPATVKAITTIIEAVSGQQLADSVKNKTVTIIGQGRLVGKPLADYLENQGARVTRLDENTGSLSLRAQSKKADVLVSATGVPSLVKADMIKLGAIVIDCGSPKAEVDFEKVKDIAGAITPVPGGVGPLTVVSLLENTVEAAKLLMINE